MTHSLAAHLYRVERAQRPSVHTKKRGRSQAKVWSDNAQRMPPHPLPLIELIQTKAAPSPCQSPAQARHKTGADQLSVRHDRIQRRPKPAIYRASDLISGCRFGGRHNGKPQQPPPMARKHISAHPKARGGVLPKDVSVVHQKPYPKRHHLRRQSTGRQCPFRGTIMSIFGFSRLWAESTHGGYFDAKRQIFPCGIADCFSILHNEPVS